MKIKHPSGRYYLLIGERGMGKTHLLHLLYYGIREEKELRNKFLPIKLMEEEYSIASVEDLVVRIVQEGGRKNFSGDVIEGIKELKEREKKIIVIIDNLDQIFLQINDLHNLRYLFEEEAFLIIGSSLPLRKKEKLFSSFELIQIPELKPLEAEELILKHAKLRGVEDPKGFGRKVKAITHLIGGNPRYILMVYRIFESGVDDMEEVLERLFDELTPHFKLEMNKLSPQQRKILGILASESKPLTPTALSQLSRLKVNVVTSQMKRLMDFGYIVPFGKKKRKAVFYEVGDRIFRVWHEMKTKDGKERIISFLKFLEIWHTPKGSLEEELREGVEFIEELQEIRYTEHQSQVMILLERGEKEKAQQEVERLRRSGQLEVALSEEAILHFLMGNKEREIITLSKLIELNPASPAPRFNRGVCLTGLRRYEEALKDFNAITRLIPHFAEAQLYQGIILKKLGRYDDALKKIEQVLKEKENFSEAWFAQGTILLILGRYEEALPAFGKATELRPDFAEAYFNRGATFLLLKRYEDALKEMVRSFKIWKRDEDEFFLRKVVQQIIALSLILSFQYYGLKGNYESARKYLKEAFAYRKYRSEEEFLEPLIVFLKQLISNKQWRVVEEFLKILTNERIIPSEPFNPLSSLLGCLKEGKSGFLSEKLESYNGDEFFNFGKVTDACGST